MAKTAQDLAEEVLLELGRADGAGPADDPDDIAFVKRRYDSIFADGVDTDWAFWDKGAIPDRAFIALAQHVAVSCRDAFGRADYNPVNSEGRTPLQVLKRLGHEPASGLIVKGEYF